MTRQEKPLLGISSCLLGNEVRYDGGHKHNRYITLSLGEHLAFTSFCPEVAIGLSTPRPPIRLISGDAGVRAVKVQDGNIDYTTQLQQYGNSVSRQLRNLSGFILKKDSPSCGMERVKVYYKDQPQRDGTGIFASAIMNADPTLPLEEEGRLNDPILQDNFIVRVFTRFRWLNLLEEGLTPGKLVAFHSQHKFLFQAHDETGYRELGRLVADAGKLETSTLAQAYFGLAMDTLKHHATIGRHVNVLTHMMGFLKNEMEADDKKEMLSVIKDYQDGLIPLVVPVTLLNHYRRRYPNTYLDNQVYLEPHPRELMLRNSL